MFSKQSDLWSTPQAFFDALNTEFKFKVDLAASAENAKCAKWFGPGSRTEDALAVNWPAGGALWDSSQVATSAEGASCAMPYKPARAANDRTRVRELAERVGFEPNRIL